MAGNLVLRALPAAERDWLMARAHEVRAQRGELVHVASEKLAWHYFPADCVIASYGVAKSGTTAEYAMVGPEGYTGVSAVLGDARGIGNAVVVVGGPCLRIPVASVQEAFGRGGTLQAVMLRFASLRAIHLSQTSLCASHHRVAPRLARWLLQVFDRAPADALHITHELIAGALGVRREAVSLAMHALQTAQAIGAKRGQIVLRDRRRLESKACECYAALSAELRKLLVELDAASSNGSQAK